MPGLVLCNWLELRAAKGRGSLDSYSCVVPSKLNRNAFSYHCCIACVAFFFWKLSKCFCRSMINYTWLLLSGWNSLTRWTWSRIEMVQICTVQILSKQCSSWFLMLKLVDAALKGSFCPASCLNCEDAADSSPDAPQCQADILAISAADLFV